jgi:hypothetical protein
VLRRRADGACAHLADDGRCGVYEHRPRGCRAYDCRIVALCGLRDRFVRDRQPPEWRFEVPTRREKAIVAALRMGVGLDAAGLRQKSTGEPREWASRFWVGMRLEASLGSVAPPE